MVYRLRIASMQYMIFILHINKIRKLKSKALSDFLGCIYCIYFVLYLITTGVQAESCHPFLSLMNSIPIFRKQSIVHRENTKAKINT